MTKLIELETYKYKLGVGGMKPVTIDGESKLIKIDKKWLQNEIYPQTIEEFLSEYTYDESDYLYREYTNFKNIKQNII